MIEAVTLENFRLFRLLDREGEEIIPRYYTYEILGAGLERSWEVR